MRPFGVEKQRQVMVIIDQLTVSGESRAQLAFNSENE
jgi:hypothetical protein